MSSQPPSNGNMEINDSDYGTSTETFFSDTATLWLMDYDHDHETHIVSQGVFSCTVVTSHFNPIFAASCKLGTFCWPVTKDAPVIHVGQQRFMFAVPGLVYGLQLPQNCSEEILNQVVMFLRVHARYEDKREIEMAIAFPLGNEEEFWIISKQETQQLLLDRLAEYDYHPPSPTIARARECPRSARFGRLSTVTQTIDEAILSGSIEPVNIEVHNLLSDHHDGRAFPSIFMFKTMVDAIELRRLLSDEEYASVGQDDVVPADYLDFAVWSLRRNKVYDLATTLCRFEQETFDVYRNIDFLVNQGNASDDEDGLDDDYDEDDDGEGTDDAGDDSNGGSDDEGSYDASDFEQNGDATDDSNGSSDDDDDDGDDDDVGGFPYYY